MSSTMTPTDEPSVLLTLLRGTWAAWLPSDASPVALDDAAVRSIGAVGHGPELRATPIELPEATGPLPDGLRPSRHLGLRPFAEGGFVAWSAEARCYVRVPVSVAMAIGELAGRAEDDPAPAEIDEVLTERLVELGLLVRPEDFQPPPIRKNEVLAFARYAVSGMARKFRKQASKDDLQGKIPVYFAGCLDLERDIGYGYLNLALGMLMAAAKDHDGGALEDRYYFVPDFLLSATALKAAGKAYGPGLVFFSNYIWAHRDNLSAAAALKEQDPRFVTVFGGPQAPAYPKAAQAFFEEHDAVDVIVRGEGERTGVELLDLLTWSDGQADLQALAPVTGLTFRSPADGSVQRNGDRPRVKELDELPSPYLAGVFDNVPKHFVYGATLETNRGCPYGCTYCDWGSATLQKIRKFDMERVRGELDWMGRAGISVIFVADANFGIFERDVEIAKMIVEMAERYGSLRQVVTNYAKNATVKVAEIIRIFSRAGLASDGVISIQTRDAETLKTVRRSNIKNKRYDELVEVFRNERLPISTDLMIALPGSTTTSFKADLQHYFEIGVQAKAYLTRLLANSPMADERYRAAHGIITDSEGFIRASKTFTEEDVTYMLQLFGLYSLTIRFGLAKYLLRYLQWGHDIRAIDFIDGLLAAVHDDPAAYPHLHWCLGFLEAQRRSPGGWRPFLEEIAGFAQSRFGVPWDDRMEAVLLAQEVVLADADRSAERTWSLPYDVVAYMADGGARPLESYGPGELTVKDPFFLCRMDPVRHYQYDTHSVGWELDSPLNDVLRPTFFLESDDLTAVSWPRRATLGQRAQ